MSSPFRNWSLRARLVLGVLILTGLGFLVSSVVTQSLLKSYLTSQIDDQLRAIAGGTIPQILQSGIARREDDDDHRDAIPAPLQRIPTSASVTLLDPNGKIIGDIGGDLSSAQIRDYLEGVTPKEIALHGEEPFTFGADHVAFRVIAHVLPKNTGIVVAAQSLNELDNTLDKLGWLFRLIGLVLLLLIAAAARTVIRISLRPLEDVEKTAEDIAAGNLSARMPDAEPSTEVGRLITSLNAMLAKIEIAFQARTESEVRLRRFVADASHELRTPITAIRGFSELHRQGAVAEGAETSALLGRIENESKRMGSLVEDLLLLTRMDQAREMESKPVDINDVVKEAVSSARVVSSEHPITLDLPDDEVFMLGDAARIHQVVANLLANARAHTPEGTQINVSVSADDASVSITVADSGPGISKDDQEKIFERFFRADSSRVRKGEDGSGLGLSIVDAVMRAHGGNVSVSSELGTGALFTLTFPRRES